MRACTLLLLLTHLLTIVCAQAEPCPHDAYISVIYNCLIWPDQDWASLITHQLEHLMRTGISDCATIHVVMSIPASHTNLTYDELESLLGEGRQLIRSILPVRQSTKITGTLLSQVHENSFEYPGLHLLWLLAQDVTEGFADNTYFLYFHSKGMVRHGHHRGRSTVESWLFEGTIGPWREVIASFQANATIEKAGMYPSKLGWVWFNFWWARVSYLKGTVEPVRTTRRRYYEDWLGRHYDVDTEQEAEPGEFQDCSACFATVAWGGGISYDAGDVIAVVPDDPDDDGFNLHGSKLA